MAGAGAGGHLKWSRDEQRGQGGRTDDGEVRRPSGDGWACSGWPLGVALGVVPIIEGEFIWRAAAIGAAVAFVSWVVLIRPSVQAHKDGLLLCNMLHDTYDPVGQHRAVQVSADVAGRHAEGTFQGFGLIRSTRSIVRQEVGFTSMLGQVFGGRAAESRQTGPGEDPHSISYPDFVETRILQLAREYPPRFPPGGRLLGTAAHRHPRSRGHPPRGGHPRLARRRTTALAATCQNVNRL